MTTVPSKLGGLNAGPRRTFRNWASTDSRFAGAMSVTLVSSSSCSANGGGFTGNRLRRPGVLARYVGRGHWLFFDVEERPAGFAFEQIHVARLGDLGDGVDLPTVVRDRD